METPWYKDKLLLSKHKKKEPLAQYTIKEPLPDIKLSKKNQGDPQVTESCSAPFTISNIHTIFIISENVLWICDGI